MAKQQARSRVKIRIRIRIRRGQTAQSPLDRNTPYMLLYSYKPDPKSYFLPLPLLVTAVKKKAHEKYKSILRVVF